MKWLRLIFVFSFFFFQFVHAQNLPPFKTLRYEEDYSTLKDDSDKSAYNRAKFLSLNPTGSTYLSFGGEIRYQYFNIRNEDWGDTPRDTDGYLLSRFLIHSDFHAGKNFRTFLQLQGSMANGKASGTSPVEENPLEAHQAFVDVTTNDKSIIIRAGRQEFSYGSQRLISLRELPNNRQSFNAAKIIYQFSSRYRLDAFYGNYVSAKKGIFDDAGNKNINFWGAYLVINKITFLQNADIYYVGLEKKTVTFNDGTGKEIRHSMGSRIWGSSNGWKFDFEGVYQFGIFAGKTISAWTISSNTTYKFTRAAWKPELGLKTEFISGDKQEGDDKLQTFNPLFPRGAYFGLAAFIGPANLFDIHPSIAFELVKDKLIWSTDYDAFWRQTTGDGIYAVNVSVIYPSGNSVHKFIGNQLATDFTYTPNKFLLLRAEATWFNAGDFLKDAGAGKDILFTGVTAQLKF